MQTNLAGFIKDTPEGREAEAILRKCVHCGFCTATCPTYQLLGDELDGPRGRIYLIKQVLEGQRATVKTRLHLDRCLTCRACETTCPSGVEYGRLADIGRHVVEQQVPRTGSDRVLRGALREFVPRSGLFGTALGLGRVFKPLLPRVLSAKVSPGRAAGVWPAPRHDRRMLVLAGCVQPAMRPSINAATARVLDALGISLIEAAGAGCCGAVRFHLQDHDGGRADARRKHGGLDVQATTRQLYAIHRWARIPTRVLVRVAMGTTRNWDELQGLVRTVDWGQYFPTSAGSDGSAGAAEAGRRTARRQSPIGALPPGGDRRTGGRRSRSARSRRLPGARRPSTSASTATAPSSASTPRANCCTAAAGAARHTGRRCAPPSLQPWCAPAGGTARYR